MYTQKTFTTAQSISTDGINSDRLSMKTASSMSSLRSNLTAKYNHHQFEMSPPEFEDFIDAEVHRTLHPDGSALPEPPYLLVTIILTLKSKFLATFLKKQKLRCKN